MPALIYTPTKHVQEFPSSTCSSELATFCFWFVILVGVRWYLIAILMWISLYAGDSEQFFIFCWPFAFENHLLTSVCCFPALVVSSAVIEFCVSRLCQITDGYWMLRGTVQEKDSLGKRDPIRLRRKQFLVLPSRVGWLLFTVVLYIFMKRRSKHPIPRPAKGEALLALIWTTQTIYMHWKATLKMCKVIVKHKGK